MSEENKPEEAREKLERKTFYFLNSDGLLTAYCDSDEEDSEEEILAEYDDSDEEDSEEEILADDYDNTKLEVSEAHKSVRNADNKPSTNMISMNIMNKNMKERVEEALRQRTGRGEN